MGPHSGTWGDRPARANVSGPTVMAPPTRGWGSSSVTICLAGNPPEGGAAERSAADPLVPGVVALLGGGCNQGAAGWADVAGPKGSPYEGSHSAYAVVGLDEPEPVERTPQA